MSSNLEQDREWGPLLLIIRFLDKKAGKGLESFVDLQRETVDVKGLQRCPMSSGEGFLVDLALHLFNCSDNPLPKDGLGGMGGLGGDYLIIAIRAISIRFQGGI